MVLAGLFIFWNDSEDFFIDLTKVESKFDHYAYQTELRHRGIPGSGTFFL